MKYCHTRYFREVFLNSIPSVLPCCTGEFKFVQILPTVAVSRYKMILGLQDIFPSSLPLPRKHIHKFIQRYIHLHLSPDPSTHTPNQSITSHPHPPPLPSVLLVLHITILEACRIRGQRPHTVPFPKLACNWGSATPIPDLM